MRKLTIQLCGIVAVLYCTFAHGAPLPMAVITELYRDPPGSESGAGSGASHEFIEFVNTGTAPLRIDSLYISNGIEADSVVPVTGVLPGHESCMAGSTLLPVGSVAVILDPDYLDFCTTSLTGRHPLAAGTVLLQCGDREFGQSGLAADHGVILYKGTKSRIDLLLASATDEKMPGVLPVGTTLRLSLPKNREGISLGVRSFFDDPLRYDLTDDAVDPGSVRQLRGAVLLETGFGLFDKGTSQLPCTLRIALLNGTQTPSVPVRLLSLDGDVSHSAGEMVLRVASRYGEFPTSLAIDGNALQAEVDFEEPLRWPLNWQDAVIPAQSLLFTEIFPCAATYEPEWVELHNRTRVPFNLNGCRLVIGEDSVLIADSTMKLPPDSFLVLTGMVSSFRQKYPAVDAVFATSGSWRALSNTGDTVKLMAPDGSVVDSMRYSAAEYGFWPSVSIERQTDGAGVPAVWTPAERSTPGMRSSAVLVGKTRREWIDISPVPFTPDNDGREDVLTILNNAPPGAGVTFIIYGCDGRVLHEIDKSTMRTHTWNGRGRNGAAPVGPFFVVAEVLYGGREYLVRKKGVLWRR